MFDVAEGTGDGVAIHAGQLDVQHDQVGPQLLRERDAARAIGSVHDSIPPFFEEECREVAVFLVVFDQEQSRVHGADGFCKGCSPRKAFPAGS